MGGSRTFLKTWVLGLSRLGITKGCRPKSCRQKRSRKAFPNLLIHKSVVKSIGNRDCLLLVMLQEHSQCTR